MKKKFIPLILFCLILFGACERKLTEENHVDAEKPAPLTNYNMEINDENAGTTITVHYPCLKYKFNYPDDCSAKIIISHDRKKDTVAIRQTGYIPIPTNDLEVGLKLLLFDKSEDSESGSLAGRSGIPVDSLQWKIIPDMKPTVLSVDARLHQEGYQLYWSKPIAYYGDPSYYEVKQYGIEKIITHDTLISLDTLRNNVYYTVKAVYDNEYMNTWEGEMFLSLKTEITAQELSNEELQISWTPAYNAVYDLFLGDSLQASDIKDTAFIVKNVAFGEETIIKVAAKFGTLEELTFATFKRGTELGQSETNIFEYGAVDNVIYSVSEASIYSYQPPEMQRIASNSSALSKNYTAIRRSIDESKILGVSGNICEIFLKKNLTRERVVNLRGTADAAKVTMSNDQTIYLLALYSDAMRCEKYSLNSGFLEEFELKTPQDKSTVEMDISINGKYIYVFDRMYNRFDYYTASDNGYDTLYNDLSPYEKFCFNPRNEEELYAQRENVIEILNCADLSVKKEMRISEGKLCNIDPKTGNLLCEAEDKLLILDHNGIPLLTVNFKSASLLHQPYLIGGILFYEKHFLDISKYL